MTTLQRYQATLDRLALVMLDQDIEAASQIEPPFAGVEPEFDEAPGPLSARLFAMRERGFI